jgi:NAD(P)-dependent dehydrogenase (short-subunit alcohol dehydrogenase family)
MAGRIVGRGNQPFDLETFKYVIQINLFGTFNVCRLVAAHMASLEPDAESQERGCLVMVSSAAATQGQVGQVSYSASKGAINALTLPMVCTSAARDDEANSRHATWQSSVSAQ